jgi:hypothetical protein
MFRRSLAAALAAAIALLPSTALSWGSSAHRGIMRRAIDILPPEIKPFFVAHRDELIYRSIDPDTWRSVGWEEDPNHFINFGAPELGRSGTEMPRDHTAALQRFGPALLAKLGTLPWREAEMFGNLQRAFESIGRGNGYAAQDIVVFSAAASHYLEDATQPLHASNNYDGQLTRQRGVHARFEAELFERFESRLTLTPAPPRVFASPRDFAFDTLLASFQNVDALLAADKEAIGDKDLYDDAYFEAFFMKVKPLLEERLSAAITVTASVIVSAWEQAGRPSLTIGTKREPRKRTRE